MLMHDLHISYISQPSRQQLEDYFKIRHECFCEVMHWRSFSGLEDSYDRQAYFVLVLEDGHRVVGGSRLIVHKAGSHTKLSLEDDRFSLDQAFPQLHLPEASYFEAGRLVLSQAFRRIPIVTGLIHNTVAMGQTLGCQYLFSASPAPQARYYRRILHKMGADFIIQSLPLPDKPLYEGTAHYLGFLDLRNTPNYPMLPSIDMAISSPTPLI